MAPEVLERVLAGLETKADPRVLVGFETADDAGAFLLADELALVQSVDFFTPVVDDPALYGEIAAANALSDLYAMGATPLFALSVVGFPKQGVDESVLRDIVRGGAAKLREAGVALIGGHSVQDPEIKFGYAVSGIAQPDRIWRNSGARPGDRLFLSKPIGTGIITTAGKYRKAPEEVLATAIEWMRALNGPIAEKLKGFEVHGVTDITGYGLIGHAAEMARASGCVLLICAPDVPKLAGVEELAGRGHLPGGIESNRAYAGADVGWDGVGELEQQQLLDPQTSGGLLVSLAPEAAEEFARSAAADGLFIAEIGEVRAGERGRVEVTGRMGGSTRG